MRKSNRYAVITPYYKEPPATLQRCVDSVRRQRTGADHFLIADGFPQDWLDEAGVNHLRLRHSHGDLGNTPRGIGGLVAVSQRYDGIGFLDADNWYDDDHVEACAMAAKAEGAADLVIAQRRMMRVDGTPTDYPEEFDHTDTNCYWFLEGSFPLLHHWLSMPAELGLVGDRVFYRMIKSRNLVVRRTEKITVNYTCLFESFYRALGETPPADAKPNVDWNPIYTWLLGLDVAQQRVVAERCGIDLVPLVTRTLAERSRTPELRRNSLCPCGSGKKYKHCHGALQSSRETLAPD
jgi:glycosyltransferase involved in cell wall biosynthesis